jgi:opacity protein-like surface antigen
MKQLSLLATLAALLATAGTANAANAPVNIAYPVNGSIVANNFTSSFTVNCPVGQLNKVAWYIDGSQIGSALFYDTAGIHFAYKAASGTTHSLKAVTSCGGSDIVVFKVQ